MKKRFLAFVVAIVSMIGLSSCTTTGTIIKVSEEVEYTKIENTMAEVYAKVEKGCVGIVVSDNSDSGATGSGVIYSYDSEKDMYYVVTNAHVVEDMTKCNIFFGNGRYNSAEIVGYDSKNDIAVVTFQLDLLNSGLKDSIYVNDFYNYEENDLVVVGQTVLAIGCPLGLTNYNILTTGVVSSVDEFQISTDAALNPGNSGGGLFNLEGRLIGINTEKEVWTQSTDETGAAETIPVEGRGYAMSLDVVKECINDILKNNGVVERPRFGMTVLTLNVLYGDIAEYEQYITTKEGQFDYFLVTDFDLSSAAKIAGVKVNDQLLTINGIEIKTINTISSVLNFAEMSDKIELGIYRKGTGNVTVTVDFNKTNPIV